MMMDIFIGVYHMIKQSFQLVYNLIYQMDAIPYITAAFGALTVTRYIILPAMKGRAGSSDTVRKRDNEE